MSALLDTTAAAEYLGISESLVEKDRWVGTYKIPFVKIGRSVRYRVEDLDAWAASRVRVPGKSKEAA